MVRKSEKIRIRILAPVVSALFIVLLVSLLGTYWLKQQRIAEEITHEIVEVQQLLPRLLKSDAMLMSALIDIIENDQGAQNYFTARDRDGLFKQASKLFESMRSKYRITHCYFINPDKTCFLRVHIPQSYGDKLERFTLDQAERQKKLSYGIELGPFGTFTLRVVHPWYIGNELKGYVELGMGIEHIRPQLVEILGVNLILSLDKKYLDRAKWEEGLKITGVAGKWDQFRNVVIIDKTIKDLPEAFASALEKAHREHKGMLIRAIIGNRDLGGGLAPLYDAGGRNVGDITILKDVTQLEQSWRTIMFIQIVIWAFIIFVPCAFFYSYIRRIEQNLISAREELFQKEKLSVLGQLAGGVGHELRNPLGIIKNAVYFIKMRMNAIDDPAVKDNLKIIDQELEIANRIVSDMLDFARFKTAAFTEVDLNHLVAETLSKTKIPETITVKTDFSKNTPRISIDPIQVSQIFLNLIENALEAMEGGGTLTIGTLKTHEACEVHFTDTGCGISRDNLQKIFEPLFTSKTKGIGLGLAVSKSLAEANDAVILVDSKVGKGSTFTVRFKRH